MRDALAGRVCAAAVVAVLGSTVAARAADDVPVTYTEAMTWYAEQAAAGDSEAQFLLGYARETGTLLGDVPESGIGQAADFEQARSWYAAAASQDHRRAQVRLALMLLEGRGGPADRIGARYWLEAAATAGALDAMSLLGFLLASEEPRDLVAAYRWLSLVAAEGDEVAVGNLAILSDVMTEDMRQQAAAELEAWLAAHPP